jgi:hypothetical protein
MSIAPFRRYHVSEVCHPGGFLLAFAALQKCRRNGAPSLLPDVATSLFFGQRLTNDALSTLRNQPQRRSHDQIRSASVGRADTICEFEGAHAIQLAQMMARRRQHVDTPVIQARAAIALKAPAEPGSLCNFNGLLVAWLGREDSNLRMVESKSTALPLGDAPIDCPGCGGTSLPRIPSGSAGL